MKTLKDKINLKRQKEAIEENKKMASRMDAYCEGNPPSQPPVGGGSGEYRCICHDDVCGWQWIQDIGK